MVSVLVIETGLNEESNAGLYSSLWEDSLMSVFFDAGYIVSNGTILRLEKKPVKDFPDEMRVDFEEASEGGAEYFVLALLEYRDQQGRVKPSGVSLRVFSVNTRRLIYQRNFPAGTGADLDEEYTRAKEAAKTLIPYLKD